MGKDQNKVIEIKNESNKNLKVKREKTEKTEKTEWEKTLETMMQRAYINGLSHGMKTMCGSILSKMNECQKQRMNPQKQIIELRRWCNYCLTKVSDPPKTEIEENNTENQVNQKGEKSE